jgi:RNA polymerase sigma factor (sigma-70 family)
VAFNPYLYVQLILIHNNRDREGEFKYVLAFEGFAERAWKMHYKLDSYNGIKAYLYRIVHRDSMAAVAA